MEQMDSVIVQPMGTQLIKITQEQLGKPNIALLNYVKRVNYSFHLIGKGQIISECPYEIIVCPKIATKKISEISALASKERSNQKLY
jgi:hypothetical protein